MNAINGGVDLHRVDESNRGHARPRWSSLRISPASRAFNLWLPQRICPRVSTGAAITTGGGVRGASRPNFVKKCSIFGRGDLPIVFPPKTKNSVCAKKFSDLAPSAINLRRQPQSTTSISNSTQQPPIDRHPCHQITEPPAPESVDVSSRAHGEYYSPCALVGKNRVSAVLAAKNTIKYSFDMFSIVIESAFRSSTPPTR